MEGDWRSLSRYLPKSASERWSATLSEPWSATSEETKRRVADAGVETVDDIRSAGHSLAGFSDGLAEQERSLKRFLYARLYDLPELKPVKQEAERVVAGLAAAYRADPRCCRRFGIAMARSSTTCAPSATSSPA